MSEMIPCPFCGWEFAEHAWNEFGEEYRVCDQCGASSGTVDSKWDWQSRPIEDELRKRIAELEGEVEALKAEHRWIPVSEPPKIDGTYLLRNICTDVYSCNFIADTNTWVLSEYDSITHWMPFPKLPEVQE